MGRVSMMGQLGSALAHEINQPLGAILRNYEIMNLYAVKMAAVFIISTSTLLIRTGITPRWIAFLGYAFALFLLLSGRYIEWILMVFPLWVLLISIYILIDNLRRPSQTAATRPGPTNS